MVRGMLPERIRDGALFVLLTAVFIAAGNDSWCFVKNVYGVPCPGCGLTRSFLSLFQGEWRLALFYHPLFFLVIPVGVVAVLKNHPRWGVLYRGNAFWIVVIVLLLAAWAVRMILFFPHVPPMDLNRHSLLLQIIGL
jgi:hypothetical protein